MTDYIELKAGTGAPASLGDGEMAVDEAGRALYLNGASAIELVPLDLAAIPPGGVAGEVLVQGVSGLEWKALSAGGGGRSFDDQPWRVPGLAPIAVSSLDAHAPQAALFEIAEPVTLQQLRVRVLAGSGELQITIAPWDGAIGTPVFDGSLAVPSIGAYLVAVAQALQPGRYCVLCGAVESLTPGALTLESTIGVLPWTGALQQHPCGMGF